MKSTLSAWFADSLPASDQKLRVLAGDTLDEVPWPVAYESALRRATVLQDLGVGRQTHVGLLGEASRPLIESLLAIWLAGATPVVMPLPLRFTTVGAFIQSTTARIEEAGIEVLLVDPSLADVAAALPPGVRSEAMSTEPRTKDEVDPVVVDPSATAILQFTSGSTTTPKAVRLSHRAVTANVRAMADAAGFSPDDHFVSWLPLYHDMGLIGTTLNPLLLGAEATLLPTSNFMQAPIRWMEAISTYRGTITAAPTFAFSLAARVLPTAGDLNLSTLRIAFCGAEPIVASTLDRFVAAGVPHGLRSEAVLPCYGLAEVSLAASFRPVGQPVHVDKVDRSVLADRGLARPIAAAADGATVTNGNVCEIVSLGMPLRGTAVRVLSPEGKELGEREVGELHLASSSMMDGYLNDMHELLVDGWLATGDLGYVADGEVYVCGRVKDLIIVNGHNIHPHEVESAATEVVGVRKGGAVAFAVDGVQGHESIVVLCETSGDRGTHDELATQVRRRVRDAIGVAPSHVGILQPRQVPKTTSGKVQRHLAREMYLSGELRPVEAPA